MSPKSDSQRKKRKNKRAKLKRKKEQLYVLGNQLHRIHRAKVYILLNLDKKLGRYNSSKKQGWPPTRQQLETLNHQCYDFNGNSNQRSELDKGLSKIFKRGKDLHFSCEAEVYILIEKDGIYLSYNSSNQPDWPPPKDLLNQSFLAIEDKTPASYDERLRSAPPVNTPNNNVPDVTPTRYLTQAQESQSDMLTSEDRGFLDLVEFLNQPS